MPSLDELIQQVRVSFAGVSLGDGIGLLEAHAIDDAADDTERAKAREKDRARYANAAWHEVTHADLSRSSNALPFLDDAGVRYFLPAMIVWSLQHRDDQFRDNLLHEQILSKLRKIDPVVFTQAERKAVTAFFRFEAEDDEKYEATDGQDALADWLRSCAECGCGD